MTRITISEFYETIERVLDLGRFPNYDVKKAGLALIRENWYYGVIYDPNHSHRAVWIPYLSGREAELGEAQTEISTHLTASQIRTLLGIGDTWDYTEFQYPRQPVPVDKVLNRYAFMAPMPNVVELPIKMSGDPTIYLPYEYRGMNEALSKIIDFEKRINPHYDDYYAYITVDKKPVEAGEPQRQNGCHVDGFQSANVDPKVQTAHHYVVSDTLGDKFVTEGFEIDGMGTQVSDWFESFQHQSEYMDKVEAQPFEINLIDAYQVHTPTVATTETERTFLRVTFSVRQLAYIGNGFNPLIPYEWDYQPVDIGGQPVDFE